MFWLLSCSSIWSISHLQLLDAQVVLELTQLLEAELLQVSVVSRLIVEIVISKYLVVVYL